MKVNLLVLASLLAAQTPAAAEPARKPPPRNGEGVGTTAKEKRRALDEYLARVRDWTPRRDDGELPIGLSEEEEALMEAERRRGPPSMRGLRSRRAKQARPPPANPRFVPEWAPMRGVLIRYPFGLTVELIRAMSESASIYCLVASDRKKAASAALERGGVHLSRVEWIVGDTDSYWTRDYGPWFVYTDDADAADGLAVVNHVYNRPRPSDDLAPEKVARHMGVPYHDSGVVGTGGNMMVDGLGQAAAAHIAYTENRQCGTGDETSVPLPGCASVDRAMLDYYGVGVFYVVADPSNVYIDHIDCWAKYLSPTTVLMRKVSPAHPQYGAIERVAAYLRNVAKTSDGGRWNMVRVMTDTDQPYTNSLILNDRVFVPMVGSAASDEEALRVYRDAMPGYDVSGWTGTWESTDALHCRVRGIPESPYGGRTAVTTPAPLKLMATESPPTTHAVCGDGVCGPDETCESCSGDCAGMSEGAVCGNGICEGAGDTSGNPLKVEDTFTCPEDCNGKTNGKRDSMWYCGGVYGCGGSDPNNPSVTCYNGDPDTCTMVPTHIGTTCCGDGMCNGSETRTTCARDCGGAVTTTACNFDGECDWAAGEKVASCPADCACVRDGRCDPWEDAANCPADCGYVCGAIGQACGNKSDCCSNKCDNKGKDPTFLCKE